MAITAAEFRCVFDDLMRFDRRRAERLQIAREEIEWLVDVGLPRSAAPFLAFGHPDCLLLPPLERWWPDPDVWHELQAPAGNRYRVIGDNGSGDPVAIDTEARGEVVYLNHDNDFERTFINSSVTQLAECLVAYAQLIREAQEAHGPDAFLEGKVTPDTLARFASVLERSDPRALAHGMWAEELAALRQVTPD